MKYVCPRWIRGNRGDLISRLGILSALNKLGSKDITVFWDKNQDIFPLSYKGVENGYLYNLIPRFKGFLELLKADTVLWTAGLDLQDDSSLIKLFHTLCVFSSYRLITTRWGRWLTRIILNCLDGFLARDPGTYKTLHDINPKARMVLGYDGIFLGELDPEIISLQERAIITRFVTRTHVEQPLIGFNLRQWYHFSSSVLPYSFTKTKYLERSKQKMDQFIAASISLIEMLRGNPGARIILISAYEPDTQPWEDDLPWLKQIKNYFSQDNEVTICESPLTLLGYCNLLSKLDVVVGTRLHTTLTALRFGTPSININYTLKGRDILNSLGFPEQVVELEDFIHEPKIVYNKVDTILHDGPTRSLVTRKIEKVIEDNEQILCNFISDSKN